ncbi:TonB-dependent receptor (plasmid) [Alteromonas sp. I4]|nr:TonB-dependent receptor [Alteromonas sp. I4]
MKTSVTKIALVIGSCFAAGALAQSTETPQDDEIQFEEVVVTGTRIQNGAAAPTPVTSLNSDTLRVGAPTTIADALDKLPQFNGSFSQSDNSGGTVNNTSGNYLNLRGLEPKRALVLFDGNRMPDSALFGGVDINMIPSFMLHRVEVVTGGASAVYGSDAVAGVINFIVDKNFSGVKFEMEGGNAERGDNETKRFGIGVGESLFNGRGHFIASYNYYSSEGINSKAERSAGARSPVFVGSGTADNPFTPVLDARFNFTTDSGQVSPFWPNPAAGQMFALGGTLVPFNHGTATSSAVIESGGDGFFYDTGFFASLETHQAYARFDYDISDDVSMYVQGSFADSGNDIPFLRHTFNGSSVLGPLGGLGLQLYSDNAFLDPSASATLAQGGETFFLGRMGDNFAMIDFDTQNYFLNAGMKGMFGDFYEWNVAVSTSKTEARSATLQNINFAKQAAALDAVKDSSGNIVCRITLVDPSRFPGCVPLNLFGQGSVTDEALDFITDTTYYDLTSEMTNISASLTGSLVELPAGPLGFAVSAEYRDASLSSVSNSQPTAQADCTNLPLNCTQGTTPEYRYARVGDSSGSQSVAEGALELDIPLLADVTLVDTLSLNAAWRYTDYDTSGSVQTWKAGLDWTVNDQLRFRLTRSRDIRAPNLNELYAPFNQITTGFSDLHTNTVATTQRRTGGNEDLVPESADTSTIGLVYNPTWAPNLTLTLDYYNIEINDAIVEISAEQAQVVCEASEGADPLCDLIVRPGPFSDRSPSNYPIYIISGPVNVATFSQSGVDTDIAYRTEVGGGNLMVRGIATYVASQESQTLSSQPIIDSAGAQSAPELKTALILGYNHGDWTVNTLTRWRSSVKYSGDPRLHYDVKDIPSASFTDVTVSYDFEAFGADATAYVSMQNVFDKEAPLVYQDNGVPGFTYPSVSGDDLIGRRFNVGFKARF